MDHPVWMAITMHRSSEMEAAYRSTSRYAPGRGMGQAALLAIELITPFSEKTITDLSADSQAGQTHEAASWQRDLAWTASPDHIETVIIH